MSTMTRWIAPLVLAAGFGTAALAPAPVHAQSSDQLARVIVDVADVIFRGGDPYYRHDQRGYDDRLIVSRDRYGRPVYYREVPRHARSGPPYGKAYGYHGNAPGQQKKVKCDNRGRCEVKGTRHYYDARYDTRRYDDRYSDRRGNDRRWDDRRWDDRRWDDRRR